MDRNKTVILALCLSLAAHSVFLAVSPHIRLKGMNQIMDQTKKMFRIRDVEKQTSKVSLFKKKEPDTPSLKMTQKLSSGEGGMADNMFLEEDPAKDLSADKKKEDIRKEEIENELSDLDKTDISDILKAEEDMAKKDASPETRSR